MTICAVSSSSHLCASGRRLCPWYDAASRVLRRSYYSGGNGRKPAGNERERNVDNRGGESAASSKEVHKISHHRSRILPTVYGTKGWDKCPGHPQQRAWARGVSCFPRAAADQTFKLKGGRLDSSLRPLRNVRRVRGVLSGKSRGRSVTARLRGDRAVAFRRQSPACAPRHSRMCSSGELLSVGTERGRSGAVQLAVCPPDRRRQHEARAERFRHAKCPERCKRRRRLDFPQAFHSRPAPR